MMSLQEVKTFFADTIDHTYFGNKAGSGTFLFDRPNGKPSHGKNQGCYAGIGGISTDGGAPTVGYVSLWCRYEELLPAAIDYWSFILGPDSPWREATEGIEIIKDDEDRPVFFKISNPNACSFMLTAMAVQCRIPQESNNKLRSYWWWVNNGFTRAEALYLSELLYVHVDGSMSKTVAEDYKHALWCHDSFDVKAFEAGKTKYTKEQKAIVFSTNGMKYRGWEVPAVPGGKPLFFAFKDESLGQNKVYPLIVGTSKYTGSLPSMFIKINGGLEIKGAGCVSKEDAVKILKDNRSVWKVGSDA